MRWINFLHFYQPPTQDDGLVASIARESYSLIFSLLEKHPRAKMTFNISGSLLERLEAAGLSDIIERARNLYERGQIELVGSAMYHPILPLIPASEAERQIRLNARALRKHFGEKCHPKGFYLPEMAYDRKIAEIVAQAGFKWIILDDVGHSEGARVSVRPDILYEIQGLSLGVVFRSRALSTTFPPEHISKHKDRIGTTAITAHDAEVYGHRHTDDRGFNDLILSDKDVETLGVSEYLDSLKKEGASTEKIEPLAGSWETTREEKEGKMPFALWNEPGNAIHEKMWEFASGIMDLFDRNHNDPHHVGARTFIDKGLASCSWWWASGRKLGHFSPPAWNPEEIEKGVNCLLRAVRSLKHLPSEERISFESKACALRELIWKEHWFKKERS